MTTEAIPTPPVLNATGCNICRGCRCLPQLTRLITLVCCLLLPSSLPLAFHGLTNIWAVLVILLAKLLFKRIIRLIRLRYNLLNMDVLVPRQANTCTGNKQWYVCTAGGGFRGCCSSDPCTTGVCPDDDSSTTTKVTSTTSKSTTSSETSRASTTATATASSTETTSIDEATTATSTTSTSTPSATPTSQPTSHSSPAPIIGGVVGGVAALIIIALLVFFCWRRKRNEKQQNTDLHRSVSLESLDTEIIASPSDAGPSPLGNSTLRSNDSLPSLPTIPPSITGSPSLTGLSLSIPGLATHATSSTTTLPTISGTTASSRNIPQLPPIEMPWTESHLSSTTGKPRTPQELPDTGFYRQRAELAAQNQSELINVPYEQRRRKDRQQYRQRRPGSRSWESSPSSAATGSSRPSPCSSANTPSGISPRLMARETARRVVTREGVVLGANLEQDAEGGSKGKESVSPEDHVMSFMSYEGDLEGAARGLSKDDSVTNAADEECVSPKSDVLPAYEAGDGGFPVSRDMKTPAGTMGMRSANTQAE